MRNLEKTLQEADAAILPVLGHFWGVKTDKLDSQQAIETLLEALQDEAQIEKVWEGLDDKQRGALQMLIGSGYKMPTSKFELLYGKIRKMGRGAIEREKPHLKPESVTEALYYRGLVAEAFEKSDSGLRGIIYIPTDLAPILPVHKTAYENLEDEIDDFPEYEDDEWRITPHDGTYR